LYLLFELCSNMDYINFRIYCVCAILFVMAFIFSGSLSMKLLETIYYFFNDKSNDKSKYKIIKYFQKNDQIHDIHTTNIVFKNNVNIDELAKVEEYDMKELIAILNEKEKEQLKEYVKQLNTKDICEYNFIMSFINKLINKEVIEKKYDSNLEKFLEKETEMELEVNNNIKSLL
jgi:DNA-binding protein Fis